MNLAKIVYFGESSMRYTVLREQLIISRLSDISLSLSSELEEVISSFDRLVIGISRLPEITLIFLTVPLCSNRVVLALLHGINCII